MLFDDGNHWQPLQLNMPVAAVHDLAIEQGDLVAATYGRSFWILDDLEPLRQAKPDLGAPHLFAPRTAIRVRRDVNQGTPIPPEIPSGKNPPDGAVLDYYLPAQASGEITLEIKDRVGRLVRSYSSVRAEESGRLRTVPRPEFADYLLAIAEHYPGADTIHLVMDNLSSHIRKAVVERFGEKAGGWLWDRFTVHYTPKHGSWLNQAEIETSLFSRQCLGRRRIPSLSDLRRETRVWNRNMNRKRITIETGSSPANRHA